MRVTVERGLRCRMSDGVVLVADRYSPEGDGAWPTLLMRQPYGRDIASTVVYAHPAWWARQGYHVVIQDVRGRGDSEGEFYPFRHERRDGAETIAWVRGLAGANGDVGMYGFSYQGMTQLLAAAERPEGLKCIAPAMAACDLYRGWFYRGGALRLASTLGWGLQMLKEDARRVGLREASERLERAWANLPAQMLETPYGGHAALHGEGLPRYVLDWMEHDRAGEYWAAMDVSECLEAIEVPALHVSGWYDTYLGGSVDGFLALRERAGTAFARENQYLLAGPWVHIPWGDTVGGRALGSEAGVDTDAILLRWFDHWLKGSGGFDGEPRIRHFALDFATNAGQWHEAGEFGGSETLRLYLWSDGRANSRKGDGRLREDAGEGAADVFVYDPEVPVAGPGGLAAASGPLDQSMMEMGNNVLVYTSEPLGAAVHVFGAPVVEIHCASSAGRTDFVAKLVCVRPGRQAIFVCLGIVRSDELFPDSYAADEVREWRIEMEPTSCVFAAGDRVRLEVASSAYPLYDRNPGTDVPAREASAWNWRRSTQTVYHETGRASVLRLPVVRA